MVAGAAGTLSFAVELFVGALLLAAGTVKVRAGASAVLAAVARYEVGSGVQQRLFARLLPWVEIGIGVALILGLARDLTTIGAGALLAAFEMAMARSLSTGRQHQCGCGGDRRSTFISWTLVSRNAVLVAVLTTAEVARSTSNPWSVSNVALAAVFLASTLVTAALRIRWRAGVTPALSVAPTTSRT